METENSVVVSAASVSSKPVCLRCHRPEKRVVAQDLCNTCVTSFYAWRKRGFPQGTVLQFIEAMPFSGSRNGKRMQTNGENLSTSDMSSTRSWVRCRACGNKGTLVPERNLCPLCNKMFVDLETKRGEEITMGDFLLWYKEQENPQPLLLPVVQAAPLTESLSEGELIPGFVIGSKEMAYVAEMVMRVAATDATVCIFGETGTGKELVARAIHELSARNKKPFVVIDCTSLGQEISESELFGHGRGAFTGAQTEARGLIAAADTGSAFFDELSVLDPRIQPKLLRLLEQRHFRPVGKTDYQSVDMRVIAATNQSLEKLVTIGRFRGDLYHRFNVFPIEVPPLRERKKEILVLARYFLRQLQAAATWISQEVEAIFQHYGWPGNVRELRNVLIRALIMKGTEDRLIESKDLPLGMQTPALSRAS